MKVFSIDELSNTLDSDLTWRLREISDLKQVIRLASVSLRAASLRAAVPLLYAHWEGHVRVSASAYVGFVAARRKPLRELKLGYSLAVIRPQIDRLIARQNERIVQMEFLERVESLGDERFSSKVDKIVDTRSNLSYDILSEISAIIGVDISGLLPSRVFIDKILLERRNNIAHGQDIVISLDDFDSTADETIGIMRTFSNSVQYAALYEHYRKLIPLAVPAGSLNVAEPPKPKQS